MQNKIITTLLIMLFNLGIAFSGVEATVDNHYLLPGEELNFHIEIEEDFTGTADLKFCLAEFDFQTLNYNYRCDIFLDRFDVTFDKTYSNDYSLPLNGVQPLIYRLFVQLHFEDKYHKDSDKDNFIYLAKEDKSITYVYNPKGMKIEPFSLPEYAEQGSVTSANFNITNFGNCTKYYAYSFVNNGTNCITGKLNQNMIEIELLTSSRMNLELNNTIDYNASLGSYYYTIRLSGCGKNHDYKKPILIVEKREPAVNITINQDNELIIKNYEQVNTSYELQIILEDGTIKLNNTLIPHSQERIKLNNTNQYLEVKINNKKHYTKLLTTENNNTIIVNNTIVKSSTSTSTLLPIVRESSMITGNVTVSQGDNYYIISILIGLISLLIIYKRIK